MIWNDCKYNFVGNNIKIEILVGWIYYGYVFSNVLVFVMLLVVVFFNDFFCYKKFFWWELRIIFIYECKGKYLEGN